MIEQPLLPPPAAAVAAERTVGPDDAVAGNDDGDLVLAVDAADGADGAGRSDAARHVGVRPRLAVWDLAERLPRGELERRAALLQRQVEVAPRAGEVLAQLLRRAAQDRMVAGDDDAGFSVRRSSRSSVSSARRSTNSSSSRPSSPAIASIGPSGLSIHVAVSSAVSRARPGVSPKTRANASRNPLSDSNPASMPASIVGAPPWSAFIAVPRRHARWYAWNVIPKLRLNVRRTCTGSSPRTRRSWSRSFRSGCVLDLLEQRRQPVRRRRPRRHRLAQQARAVAAMERFLDRRRELDVLRLRLARVARRPAENPRRPHAGVEESFEGLVALDERAIHLGGRRQRHHAPEHTGARYCALPGFGRAISLAPARRWHTTTIQSDGVRRREIPNRHSAFDPTIFSGHRQSHR